MPQDNIQSVLVQILRRYGHEVLCDPRRMEALLRDLCGQQRREINILVMSMREHVAEDLLLNSAPQIPSMLYHQLVRRLQNETGLTEEFSRWAVQTWAEVLGKNILYAADTVETGDTGIHTSLPDAPTPAPTSTGQNNPPERLPVQPVHQKNDLELLLASGIRLDLVRIPAGRFSMGSKPNDSLSYANERPQSVISLPEFLIGRNPVTNRQYRVYIEATGYPPPRHWLGGNVPAGKINHPVRWISWDNAAAFCRWASQVTGRMVRLPSEAEWEKAARGAHRYTWPWGNQLPDEKRCNCDEWINDTTPVGMFNPQGNSPYGCTDMAGNVWEWTASLYRNYPYRSNDGREDPESREQRTLRGGSFRNPGRLARCSCRHYDFPEFSSDLRGFRVALPRP